MKKGKVYLIGAGPAGKDLITVKGLALLRQADVIIYDYLTDKDLLSEVKQGAQLFNCRDLGKIHGADARRSQLKINSLIVSKAKEGKIVARLKNGDPLIFGRITEELEALGHNGIEFEIVPGVSAAQFGAAFFNIPLTDRISGSSVVFVTGHEAEEKISPVIDWKNISKHNTIVLYMAVKNISKIALKLIKAGKSPNTSITAISNAGRSNQKVAITRLKDVSSAVKKRGIIAPAIFIIKDSGHD
ncbi:MAG: uroporphyrinogen-III C-methyltransferase [Candidatus Omnitrophica bacterium]|nr:uroporphyrinogen-III C-methyltransferase [Candidatus Omnitrophota bacterium]